MACRTFSLAWMLLPVAMAAGCATAPAVPPTAEAVRNHVAAHGAEDAYQRYRVTVQGNAFLGHDVQVGNTEEKAPAGTYLGAAAVPVDHLNRWATWPTFLGLLGGTVVTSTMSILIAASLIDPFTAIAALVGCAMPMLCVAYGFSVISEWGMVDAGEDYNAKLKQLIDDSAKTPVAMKY